jgi:uncharacterized protein (DUF362 family)
MDSIVAMEGNGPRSDHPRPMHILLLSDGLIAADATFCQLMGISK